MIRNSLHFQRIYIHKSFNWNESVVGSYNSFLVFIESTKLLEMKTNWCKHVEDDFHVCHLFKCTVTVDIFTIYQVFVVKVRKRPNAEDKFKYIQAFGFSK